MRLLFVFLFYSQAALAALQLVNAGVRQIEDGPAVSGGTQFVPGETVYYSVQVAGYGIDAADPEQRKVRITYTIDVLDPKGTKVVEPVAMKLGTTISEQDKEWKPKIRHEILLPTFVPPGKYKVVTAVTDDISKLSASSETIFEVTGFAVEPSTELTVHNFGFYRSEDDMKPIATAAYRAGDMLFARFNMLGYRFGERNTVDIAYDVAVLNPEGKQIYQQLSAAVEKSYSFYPKPYVPGGMNLSLQSDMRKGQYTVILTVHDFIGKQDFEMKQPFDVE